MPDWAEPVVRYILQVGLGEAASGSLESRTLFAVSAVLFLLTLGMNWVGNRLRTRNAGGLHG